MTFLLDTVALLFWWTDSQRLGPRAQAATRDDAQFQATLVARDGFRLLVVSPAHAMREGYLPGAHRDPFDRLLAGQALVEDMTILTNDAQIAAFGCKVLW